MSRWVCPHHDCLECERKAAAAGGLLFRCSMCPNAYCEDHLPLDAEIIGQCQRFELLGQNHPAQACFIYCNSACKKWEPKATELLQQARQDNKHSKYDGKNAKPKGKK